ncbi:mannose/fructose/N-acetylgalactosamine-specific phosphotransferase system component IID [Mycolicibacterium iranicum]|uniref:Mannose/fructose/N-acetylgalactosamine-specific phosphotransferase system component IID n=1 Tax=Mycolicibacterium iranicum TaxID=912594 RepID=A0A839Q3K6_MYCIR|nr:hypothetical protein [Mycolicibacterium iranicum]MBB2990013.1 mannose/fructose/N-acetylgalactosamine-specific phosphotransferase system component IID [Mycolicibacterium iranicum]
MTAPEDPATVSIRPAAGVGDGTANTTLHRVLLGVLAATGIVTGGWAFFAARHWYDTFPGLGMSWLPPLGPYNEHFVRDVGAFFLGLAVLSVLTFVHVTNTTLVRVAAST